MCREFLGSSWKIGRYPIKVSEVLEFLSRSLFTVYLGTRRVQQVCVTVFTVYLGTRRVQQVCDLL